MLYNEWLRKKILTFDRGVGITPKLSKVIFRHRIPFRLAPLYLSVDINGDAPDAEKVNWVNTLNDAVSRDVYVLLTNAVFINLLKLIVTLTLSCYFLFPMEFTKHKQQ